MLLFLLKKTATAKIITFCTACDEDSCGTKRSLLDVIKNGAEGAESGKRCLGKVPSAWWKYGILKLLPFETVKLVISSILDRLLFKIWGKVQFEMGNCRPYHQVWYLQVYISVYRLIKNKKVMSISAFWLATLFASNRWVLVIWISRIAPYNYNRVFISSV